MHFAHMGFYVCLLSTYTWDTTEGRPAWDNVKYFLLDETNVLWFKWVVFEYFQQMLLKEYARLG